MQQSRWMLNLICLFLAGVALFFNPLYSETPPPPEPPVAVPAKPVLPPPPTEAQLRKQALKAQADSLISFAMQHLGAPYQYGATGHRRFDCSGFTTFVFSSFGFAIPRSSALQANFGRTIAREKARKGDLIIFTGTNPRKRTPGHVGIVISDPGEPLKFVHASSNGGVKISQVEHTRYETRFLEIRRVL